MPDTEWRPPPARSEHLAPALLCVLSTIVVQAVLPNRLTPGPQWLLPTLEGALLVALTIASPMRLEGEHSLRRILALSVTGLVSLANLVSLALLSHYLVDHNVTNGRSLIVAGALIWLTNVLIFGLWYWEVDRGGAGRRAAGDDDLPDLLFPQMTDLRFSGADWRPLFLDYLYVSFTNATAFSPTDTMPLTRTAKAMMTLQSLVALVTIGLVVSRAVNILA